MKYCNLSSNTALHHVNIVLKFVVGTYTATEGTQLWLNQTMECDQTYTSGFES